VPNLDRLIVVIGNRGVVIEKITAARVMQTRVLEGHFPYEDEKIYAGESGGHGACGSALAG
jgi:hypothetical protein